MRKRNEKLEKDFQEALESDYEIWKERRAKGDRSGVRFRGMLTRLGGVRSLPPTKSSKPRIGCNPWAQSEAGGVSNLTNYAVKEAVRRLSLRLLLAGRAAASRNVGSSSGGNRDQTRRPSNVD